MFGVAVNHFRKANHPISVQQSTKFALSLLKNCIEITTIVVIDSSEHYDSDLDDFCQSINASYHHYGRILSFAEAYNCGVALLSEEWVVTMASDIYVLPNTFTSFESFIKTHPNEPIGCLIPYLSTSDYSLQEALRLKKRQSCYAGIMTYNLNVFPKNVFKALGGLSTEYSGNFNDIETSLRLRDLNLEVILVDSFAYHYGRMTLQHGSTVDLTDDCKKFQVNHPQMLVSNTSRIRLDKVYTHPLLKAAFCLSLSIRPRRLRISLENWIYKNAPSLQRVRGI